MEWVWIGILLIVGAMMDRVIGGFWERRALVKKYRAPRRFQECAP